MSKKGNKRKIAYDTIIQQRTDRLRKSQLPVIGIDIGSSYIKVVQMKNKKVIKCGMEALPEGMINQGRIEAPAQLAQVIKKLLKNSKISGNECCICLSGNEIVVRELKLPEMDVAQIMENINHEITSFLPMNQEEYCIDYKILEYLPPQEGTLGKLRIMVAAVPNNLVQAYIDTLKLIKLKTVYVDVVPNVFSKLTKQLTIQGVLQEHMNNIGIIDFGAYSTNVMIVKDLNYFLHKSITNGGDYLTSQIAKKQNIDNMEAEEYKRKINFFENNFHNNDYLYVKNYVDYQINDIERTIDFFKNRNNQIGIDILYITGGGSLLKGLPEYLKEHFNVEVTPLTSILRQLKKSDESMQSMAFYSQAIGVTLREE